jgi:hypothetical protein
MKRLLAKIRCWFRHDWAFAGGRWVIQGQLAITQRSYQRCGRYQEIAEDHMNQMRICDVDEIRWPPVPAKYPR